MRWAGFWMVPVLTLVAALAMAKGHDRKVVDATGAAKTTASGKSVSTGE